MQVPGTIISSAREDKCVLSVYSTSSLNFRAKSATFSSVKPLSHSSRTKPLPGFSLVELLVVIAIAAILGTMAVAGMGAIGSSRVTTAAIELRATAELARQTAITSGRPVELRFYKPDNSAGEYSGFRIVKINGTNETKLKLVRLPDGIAMRSSAKGSTILSSAPLTNDAAAGFIAAETRRVRFLPSGSIEGFAAGAPQTVSIARAAEPAVANELPANFATVSFDTVLGTTAVYRP